MVKVEDGEAVEAQVIKVEALTKGEVGFTVEIQATADLDQQKAERCCVYFQCPVRQRDGAASHSGRAA
jgi:hypothetical protein|tara:strand:+ start:394 stop:597 length:204 start_codon:yes stop_codon:yes gene_type:complete